MLPGVCMADFNAISAENSALKDRVAGLCAENSSLQEQACLRQGDPISATGAGICASGGGAQPRDGGSSTDDNTALKADVQNLRDENNCNRVFAETQYYADQRFIS